MKECSHKPNNLLIFSPHFRLFIREQIIELSKYFSATTVVIPHPRFPKFLLKIPTFSNKYGFLKNIVESITSPNHKRLCIIHQKYSTLPFEVFRKRTSIIFAQKSLKMLKKTSIKFNLIHAHRLDIGYAGALVKSIFNRPLVVTTHGSDVYEFPFSDDYHYKIVKYTLSNADHIIAVSHSDAEMLKQLGIRPNKISIIPNGYNDKIFQPVPKILAREKLGLHSGKKILLSIGTLHDVKGHTFLIDAIYKICKSNNINNLLVFIVGTGPLKISLEKKIKDHNLDDIVRLVGWVPHNELPLWINASDVFVLPSLNEGLPTVIPEVMACGRPTVATKVGGVPDIISNEEYGILVKPKDAEALAQGIVEALNRKWNSEKIRKHAENYSLSSITKQIFAVYQGILYGTE